MKEREQVLLPLFYEWESWGSERVNILQQPMKDPTSSQILVQFCV